jgi:hypothetical protein
VPVDEQADLLEVVRRRLVSRALIQSTAFVRAAKRFSKK